MRRGLLGAFFIAAGVAALPLHVAADTQTTPCPAGTNCKTITIDDNGKLTSSSTGGTISFYDLNAGTYTLVDALQGLPQGPVQQGSYTLTWATCAHGSATGGSYTVGSGGSYPSTAPGTGGTVPTITPDSGGAFVCAYTLAYPATPPDLRSVRNDVWVSSGGTVKTRVASASVPPGGTPFVPDVPFAILVPIGVLAVIVGYVVIRQRRSATAVP